MAYSGAFLAILEILKKHYKPEGLSRNEIESYLSEDYGIEFDRRTFGKAIDEINATEEYRVISTKGKYSRYKLEMKYALTQEEILLVSALIADTDVLSRLEADRLIEKLCVTFQSSFDTEDKIDEIKKEAVSYKNEINGLDKLGLIIRAVKNNTAVKFKIYDGNSFTDYIITNPIKWYAESGDIVISCDENEYRLSQIYNLDIV